VRDEQDVGQKDDPLVEARDRSLQRDDVDVRRRVDARQDARRAVFVDGEAALAREALQLGVGLEVERDTR
jgi:hypothetical protein